MPRPRTIRGWSLALALLSPLPAPAAPAIIDTYTDEAGQVFPWDDWGGQIQALWIAFTPTATTLITSASYTSRSAAIFVLPLPARPVALDEAPVDLFVHLEARTGPVIEIVTRVDSETSAASIPPERGETDNYNYTVLGPDDDVHIGDWLTERGVAHQWTEHFTALAEDGWYFVTTQLRPSEEGRWLAPLRIQLPALEAKDASFDLAALVGTNSSEGVPLTLYIASDDDLEPSGFPVEELGLDNLRATAPDDSNFLELFEAALGPANRRAFVREFRGHISSTLPEAQAHIDAPTDLRLGPWAEREGITSARIARYRTRLESESLPQLQFRTAEDTEDLWLGRLRVEYQEEPSETGCQRPLERSHALWWSLLGIGPRS